MQAAIAKMAEHQIARRSRRAPTVAAEWDLSVDVIPQDREHRARGKSDRRRHDHKDRRHTGNERPHRIRRAYEVHSEHEINNRLRPTERYHQGPQQMPEADQAT